MRLENNFGIEGRDALLPRAIVKNMKYFIFYFLDRKIIDSHAKNFTAVVHSHSFVI